MLALKLVRRLDALAVPLSLTVDDMVERLGGIRLVGIVPPGLELWRLPDTFPAAQQARSKKFSMHSLPCHLLRCL
jgi:hypothetical protein